MFSNKKTKAFTLIEIIIVIVIVGILASISAPMIYKAAQASTQEYNVSNVSGQARLALTRMVRELRMIRSNSASDLTMGADQITFTTVDGQTITYLLSGTTLMRNSQALANDISALSFTYQDGAGETTAVVGDIRYITISLTATSDDSSVSVQDTIFLRNT